MTHLNDNSMETLEKVKEKIKSDENGREGKVAKFIEKQTAKLPSDLFLWASIGSIGASLVLKLMKKDKISLFIGQWVSPFLLFGVYNKIVKVHGSER